MTIEEKALHVTKLYANESFQKLILGIYIDEDIHSMVMQDNVDSEAIRNQLKARKVFSDYMYAIIEEAEIAKSESKE